MRVSDDEMRALRSAAEAAVARPVIRFIDLDPRVALRLLDEIVYWRGAKANENRRRNDPALRD